ncbi:MAG: peptidase U32 family protein [Eggerthella lenta]
MSHAIELLAPAGNAAALRAAVRGGADAVYLGLDSFNARRGADNFTLETLADACAYAHLRGVRVYVTFNTAVLPSEVACARNGAPGVSRWGGCLHRARHRHRIRDLPRAPRSATAYRRR